MIRILGTRSIQSYYLEMIQTSKDIDQNKHICSTLIFFFQRCSTLIFFFKPGSPRTRVITTPDPPLLHLPPPHRPPQGIQRVGVDWVETRPPFFNAFYSRVVSTTKVNARSWPSVSITFPSYERMLKCMIPRRDGS